MNLYPLADSEVKDAASVMKNIVAYFTDAALWINVSLAVIKMIAIWIIGRIVVKILKKAIDHMLQERQRNPFKFDVRRTKTIGRLVSNMFGYTVNFIVILLILNQFGINLAPLLAGAGVLGLAIGFGAQSLVKDVITGFFIIFEDQFAVGDVIQIGNYKGNVEEIGLRVTRLRSWTGEVHIVPNGTIQDVTNFSIHNSLAVVDMSIAYEENVERAVEVIKQAAASVYENHPDIVKAPEVLGVQNLGATEVIIRVTAECRPNMAAPVTRIIRAELKKALEKHGIEIPYQRVVNFVRSEKAES